VNMTLQFAEKAVREVKLGDAKFVDASKRSDSPERRGIAKIVGDHYRRIQRLEIEYDERAIVERRERLHNQGHSLSCVLLTNLR
jgi:hypothetical protein